MRCLYNIRDREKGEQRKENEIEREREKERERGGSRKRKEGREIMRQIERVSVQEREGECMAEREK